jgi:hypothetical protein
MRAAVPPAASVTTGDDPPKVIALTVVGAPELFVDIRGAE